jgi:hypothetical protein
MDVPQFSYQIIQDYNPGRLAIAVSEMLAKGYMLHGPLIVSEKTTERTYIQAVVLPALKPQPKPKAKKEKKEEPNEYS